MKRAISIFLYHFFHVPLYILAKILFRYRAVGSENIPSCGPALLASNHASYLDPPLVGLGIWRRIHYLAKEDLFCNRIVSFILDLFHAIPVNRDRMDKRTLRRILDLFKKGEILLIFPEGTRTPNGNLQPLKPGIGMIVCLAKVPVIPVYIKGSYNILPRHSKMIRLKPCTVYYGKPLKFEKYLNEKKTKEVYEKIGDEIFKAMKDLERRARDEL